MEDDSIGYKSKDEVKHFFCNQEVIDTPGCTKDTLGKLILPYKHWVEQKSNWSEAATEMEGVFEVPYTGYFCIKLVNPSLSPIRIKAEFLNPHGQLPAEYRPLMMLSVWLAGLYLVSFGVWSLLLSRYKKEIVSFQKYVAGMLGLSFFENLVYYMFYSHYNSTGGSSSFLLGLAAIVGSTRMTCALFILLIVSMGYGTVLASLEDRAKPIYALTGFYLLMSVANILASLTTRTSGQMILLISTLGITVGGAAFLTWTFDSLKATISLLTQRKQFAKLEMYDKLTTLLKALYTATIFCMMGSLVFVAGSSTSQAWYADYWSWLWFMTDGWQSILNLVGCLGAAFIFRPRQNNRTFAMNQLSSEPIDLDDVDVEQGAIDMKTYKSYELKTKQEEEREDDGGGYARLQNPEWANPFSTSDNEH